MNQTVSAQYNPSNEDIAALQRLQNLTHEYALFSRDAVGLGHVIGGALVFIILFLLRAHFLHTWEGIFLGATPYIWIVAKEQLRFHYYQFSGQVTLPTRRWHNLILGILAPFFAMGMVAIIVALKLSPRFFQGGPIALGPVRNATLCLVILLAMPFLTWRYLRSPYEFVTGVYLLSLSAFLLSGNLQIGEVFGGGLGIVAGAVALVMILAGYAEHMKFIRLRREIRALKEPA